MSLVDVAPAMRDPVSGTQACFRALLQALSRPGLVVDLPAQALRGLGSPRAADGRPLSEGLAALLLTLLDTETRAHWHGRLGCEATQQWLRFHTGARPADDAGTAEFVLARAEDLTPDCWTTLALGDDETPQQGCTLVVELPSPPATAPHAADGGVVLALQGPGIADTQRLQVSGLAASFWRYRQSLQPRFPRGFELVLVNGRHIAALPRSTRITLEA